MDPMTTSSESEEGRRPHPLQKITRKSDCSRGRRRGWLRLLMRDVSLPRLRNRFCRESTRPSTKSVKSSRPQVCVLFITHLEGFLPLATVPQNVTPGCSSDGHNRASKIEFQISVMGSHFTNLVPHNEFSTT